MFSKSTSKSKNKTMSFKVPSHAKNPLNQYFMEKFKIIKRDSDIKGITTTSSCYRNIIKSLSKYPLPILCPE
jgi:hypothetical protein